MLETLFSAIGILLGLGLIGVVLVIGVITIVIVLIKGLIGTFGPKKKGDGS